MNKIRTVFDVRQEKWLADARMEARNAKRGRKMFFIKDQRGLIVGICQTQKAADAFIRDSLNTEGWSINHEVAA